MGKHVRWIGAIVGAVVLACMLLVSIAAAGYKKGAHAGTTSQGESITFKAKKLEVKKFNYTVSMDCEDGSSRWINGTDGAAPTSGKGKFHVTFVGEGITSVVRGKLKRRRGAGEIQTEGVAESGAPCSSPISSRCYGWMII